MLTPQWGYLSITNPRRHLPHRAEPLLWAGTSLVARLTHTISPTLLNDLVVSYVNSNITLTDQNGPGGAQFQRNPSLDQPLVTDPSAPGQCNPALSVDPVTAFPQCAIGYIFNNGFGGKMPGVAFLGTNAAYGGQGFAADPAYMPWGHTNPTYAVRDDVGKALGKHTLQFGAQYVYSQRNQTNNAIGAASGDLQGLLTFSNLTHSTGNAFADFLVKSNANVHSILQGFIQSFTQDSAQRRYYQRYQIAEPYFQDDWKITQRLTLNLGLRISLFGTYSEKNRNAWNWEASRFNASRFAVDPVYGELLDKNAGSSSGAVQSRHFPAGSRRGERLGPGSVRLERHARELHERTSVQSGAASRFCLGSVGRRQNIDPRRLWHLFEHGTGNEANTGSLEASAPVVLSMTQQLPVSYPCIGNVGYGAAFDPNQQRLCEPWRHSASGGRPSFLSMSPRFRRRRFGHTRSNGVSGCSGNCRERLWSILRMWGARERI